MLDSFEIGWQYAKKHGWLLSLVLLVVTVLLLHLTIMCYSDEFWAEYQKVVKSGDFTKVAKLTPYIEQAQMKVWLVNVLQFVLYAGVLNMALAKFDGLTEKVSLKYLSLPFMTYVKVIGVFCMFLLLMTVSVYALGLPFVYFGTRLMFMLPVLLENPDETMYSAAQKSWILTKGEFWSAFGFELLCLLIMLLGFLCFFVGVFFATAFCMYALCAYYKERKSCVASAETQI